MEQAAEPAPGMEPAAGQTAVRRRQVVTGLRLGKAGTTLF
jgi:hypothetical protein